MVGSRFKLKIKNAIKATAMGKKLRDAYQKKDFTKKNAEITYEKFASMKLEETLDKNQIIEDMLVEAKQYSFGFDEYFMYRFYKMPKAERRTYVSDRERTAYCERMNNPHNMIIFDDKSLTYKYYKKYYHRDLIGCFKRDVKTINSFTSFFDKHPKFIVKPFDGACGVGIKIVDYSLEKTEPLTVFDQLLEEYTRGFVVEELIIQCKELAAFHPESVNTVRITTIKFDDRIEVIHPFIRTGRGDAVVDNGGSGGIICSLDPETGVIIGAADETGEDYIVHPDSGLQLIGYEVPKWNEAVNLVKELVNVLPDQRYMGWDLALTDSGWVMQEANDRGAFVGFQLPIHKGFKSEIEKIVKELGIREDI